MGEKSMKRFDLLFLLVFLALTACVPPKNALVPVAYQYELEDARRLIDHNKNSQAIEQLTLLIQISPKEPEAIFLRGLAYQKLERLEKAVSDYQAVLKLNPDHLKAHYNLGMIYAFKLNDRKLALDHFDRFLT